MLPNKLQNKFQLDMWKENEIVSRELRTDGLTERWKDDRHTDITTQERMFVRNNKDYDYFIIINSKQFMLEEGTWVPL
jgi:hypothetical protein